MKRQAIPKKLRFEVFKRDHFTCVYCGAKAPDVLLQIDHIEPVSKGGKTELLNLVTCCQACNSGKGARRLSDTTTIAKQRKQLEELAAHKEQIDMMLQWQKELRQERDRLLDHIIESWNSRTPGWIVSKQGYRIFRRLLRDFTLPEIENAMDIAADSYLEYNEQGLCTRSSVAVAQSKLYGICWNTRQDKQNPTEAQLRRIRGYLRKRGFRLNEIDALELLIDAHKRGISLDRLRKWARNASCWTDWVNGMFRMIDNV